MDIFLEEQVQVQVFIIFFISSFTSFLLRAFQTIFCSIIISLNLLIEKLHIFITIFFADLIKSYFSL